MAFWKEAAGRAVLIAASSVVGVFALATEIELAPGVVYDTDIKITKAVGSPAITIQYVGGKAARAEIKVNGKVFSNKALNANRAFGEVGFNLDVALLQDGDNLIEATLYDKDGKELGTQKTVVAVQRQENLPVYIRVPKTGDSVQGAVKIDVGLGIQSKGTYVSFFVDKQFKAMKNFPPFEFLWDTTQEQNGWHEVEIWTFDDTQTTRKSPIARVFVQNPGGRTERPTPSPNTTPTPTQPLEISSPNLTAPFGGTNGLRTNSTPPGTDFNGVQASIPAGIPLLALPLVGTPISKANGQKLGGEFTPSMADVRVTTPGIAAAIKVTAPNLVASTGLPNLSVAQKPVVPIVTKPVQPITPVVENDPATITVTTGTRLPKDGSYPIFLNSEMVKFDVQPRITNGVPLTPFRHLMEHAGGKVEWQGLDKSVTANSEGTDCWFKVGDLFAKVNGKSVQMESAPFIERGRTIVPLSFMQGLLGFEIEYDTATGHVLITQKKSK